MLYIKHITGERGSMLNFIRGFCMALADSVPGVSGGTVAFLLGFYDVTRSFDVRNKRRKN